MLTPENITEKTVEELHEIIRLQNEEKNNLISQHEHEIDQLRWRINKLLHDQYSKRSEKQVSPDQASLFDEVEETVVQPTETDLATTEVDAITVPEHQRKKRGRPALPKDLLRVTRTYDLTDEEKRCPCGCELSKIGEKKREQLEFIPAQVRVIEHVRYQYACRKCTDVMKLAPLPKQPIPKSIASPGLLSHVLVSKFQDHLPFYRQEQIFDRMGIDLCRGSFCTWAQQCAELLRPLINMMRNIINRYDIGYCDETRLQVLKEPDRKANSLSYMWIFIGGEEAKCCFVYQYHPSRSHHIPKDFLSNFKGHLHTDGYSAYQTLFNNKEIPINGLHCWAHARRKFLDAAKQSKNATAANWAVKHIAALYKLEKHFKKQGYSHDEIHKQRQKKAKPILDKIKKWLNENSLKVPPKHPIGEAIQYAQKFWKNLIRYIDDGRFEIDNNFAERSIKPFVIGRKNWMFHDSVKGADAGAIIYSLIETCKAHKINPYLYLRYVLQEIPNCDKSDETYRSLLPFNIDREKIWKT